MPEIVGEFEWVGWVKEAGTVGRWRGTFSAAPGAEWKRVFAGGVDGFRWTINGAAIEFETSAIMSKVAAEAIRQTAKHADVLLGQLKQKRANEAEAQRRLKERDAEARRAAEQQYKRL